MKITAEQVQEGHFLVGIDGFVVENEENNGYLSYPSISGYSSAMPEDTRIITFHDSEGNENYLLCSPTLEIEVKK